jgi:acetyl-CoA C-acetyltransferase
VLASGDALKSSSLKPIARLVAYAHAGVDPKLMGLGPVPASRAVLKRAGLSAKDLDVIESNEAFAAQACAVTRALELDPAKVNPNGSASRSATRSARPARSSRRRRSTSCSASAGAMRW